MDPKAKTDNYREFIKQIGKYLLIIEKENKSKLESKIKEKMIKIKENKELMLEYHDNEMDDLFEVGSQSNSDNFDFSNWIKSYFTPEHLKSGDLFSFRTRTPQMRRAITKRNSKIMSLIF